MCGLAGMIGSNGAKADGAVLQRMADSMRHRGPDDSGVFVQGSVGLGFRRLSILDLSPGGHQPMFSRDGRYVIVFNGEIFNYIELRRELQTLGHEFRSSGDTEVLLASYIQWGKSCLPRMNGMWAFLIYDSHRKILFGSRDRFGVKPLYRYEAGDLVFFASEIKGILSSGYYRKETNWEVVSSFLVQQRLDVTDETFYTGICRIPAATAFELDLCGHYNEWRYWSLTNLPHNELGDPPKRFIELFEDAVDLRMRSDVPVGVCLSGGLDSTSIICSMVRTRSSIANQFCDPVWAFCYMTPEFDESRYIRDTLAQTNANLVKLEVNALHLLPKLERILWYHDEPFHTMTALIGYELMRLAAERGVKVVLSGQGADETLAGYSHYFQHYWATVVTTKGLRHAMKEVEEYTRRNGGDSKKLLAGVLLRILKGTLGQRAAYRAVAAWRRHREISRNSWYLPELLSIIPADGVAPDQELDTALRYSIEREHLPLYLRVEDRNSMAHSVEMRLPFMDYRLIAYLFQLSADWKIRGEWNKYILREAMRGRIPESVRMRRDKMGFPFPAQKWLEEGVCKSLLDLLEGQAMRERGIYDIKSIRKALEQRLTLEQNIPFEAFNVLQFEAWCQLSKSYSPEQAGCMAPATVDASGGAHAQE